MTRVFFINRERVSELSRLNDTMVTCNNPYTQDADRAVYIYLSSKLKSDEIMKKFVNEEFCSRLYKHRSNPFLVLDDLISIFPNTQLRKTNGRWIEFYVQPVEGEL